MIRFLGEGTLMRLLVDREMIRLGQNAGWLVTGQLVSKAVGLGYLFYLARRVSLAEFGWYTTALAYGAILMPAIEFGLDRIILRDGARRPEKLKELVLNTAVCRGGLVLFLAVCFWFLTQGLDYPLLMTKLLVLVTIGLVPRAVSLTLEAGFQAQEKMWISSLAMILASFVSPLVGLSLLWRGQGVIGVMIGVVFAQLSAALLVIFLARETDWFKDAHRFSWLVIRSLLDRAWPFAVLSGLSLLTLRVNIFLLSKLVAAHDLGLYNAAYKLVEVGVLIPAMFSLAVFPTFSRLVLKDRQKLKKLYFKALGLLGLIPATGAVLVTIGSEPILGTLFGQDFVPAAPTMVILAWALVVIFLNAPPAPVIQTSEYLLSYLPVALILLVVNLGLSFWWIPTIGMQGAAWAILATELVGLVVNNLFVWRIVSHQPVEA